MKIKNDDVLMHLRSFGFTCEEHTAEGFIRYNKRIGNMLITVANGQFENKIRVSLLQDKDGRIVTSYKDIMAYTDLVCAIQDAGLSIESLERNIFMEPAVDYQLDHMDNPLIAFPRKPEGFMAQ